MIILGLHFGHDASISLVKDGKILCCVELERIRRVKHAIGILPQDIELILSKFSIDVEQIEYCAVSNTQNTEYLFAHPDLFSFEIKNTAVSAQHCPHFDMEQSAREIEQAKDKGVLIKHVTNATQHPYVKRVIPELITDTQTHLPPLEHFAHAPHWQPDLPLSALQDNVNANSFSDDMLEMYWPIEMTLFGKQIPGYLFSHHFAHAASTFYTSNADNAAIFSHDGSLPQKSYVGGMYYYGEGTKIYSLTPHYLSVGHLYERVATFLGLGAEAGPGKMMGLAPYGEAVFYDAKFVSNFNYGHPVNSADVGFENWQDDNRHPLLNAWMQHVYERAVALNYDMSKLGDPEHILDKLAVDIAASTQKLLEEIMFTASEQLYDICNSHKPTAHLCLTGGVALNCPANTKMAIEGSYQSVHIPPYVHDGGLSIGGALAIYHHILGFERIEHNVDSSSHAYLGLPQPNHNDVLNTLDKSKFKVSKPDNLADIIADLMADDQYVALYQGRSEVGPRALGNRTLLANATIERNWRGINLVKRREQWRPFAPVVLAEHATDWFSNCIEPSPFMLATALCKNDKIPAVTHVDKTARIQSVGKECGLIRKILEAYYAKTQVPVLMNTSFNGPGEPIVESVDNAINFLANGDIRYLVVDQYLIEKRV
ncbi:hypothetical protein A7985_08470 [Pseudoalteromonas luteoviolacea]|uniref:Carbamoyltransferase n=1 Tax=Pseudoalteromonas luteoviolacea TaxID=43657 RepID=A0A1C0TXA2_9GAMM|nr:carbamoyltransferase C-terminal domain-containing protein [Pseudoalteromonas luteoviolacea]OCQ23955.1 hypothetical protein A7985_08470 [Pseudoalteromonas luteoviolacea]